MVSKKSRDMPPVCVLRWTLSPGDGAVVVPRQGFLTAVQRLVGLRSRFVSRVYTQVHTHVYERRVYLSRVHTHFA